MQKNCGSKIISLINFKINNVWEKNYAPNRILYRGDGAAAASYIKEQSELNNAESTTRDNLP